MTPWEGALRFANVALVVALAALATAGINVAGAKLLRLETVLVFGGTAKMRADAKAALGGLRGGSLFHLDLELWGQRLSALPGVLSVDLQRRLEKGELRVVLYEHVPLARWESGGVVDVSGVLYDGFPALGLPIFKGGDGRQSQMAEFYDTLTGVLGEDSVAQLELSPQGEWRVYLKEGIVLHLGSEQPRRRVLLYASHLPALRRQFDFRYLRAVDMRYERGFAIVYDEPLEASEASQGENEA